MPFVFYVKWRTGELVSRITMDLTLIEDTLFNNLIKGLPQALLLVVLLIKSFSINWRLTSLFLTCAPLIAYTIYRFGLIIHTLTGKKLGKIADISSVAEEVVSGIRVVKPLPEDYEADALPGKTANNFEINMSPRPHNGYAGTSDRRCWLC